MWVRKGGGRVGATQSRAFDDGLHTNLNWIHAMRKLLSLPRLTFLAACLALAGCASTQPTAYAGLVSASQLRADPDDKSGHIPYVTKQYPNALNIAASLGTMDASMAGVRKGADQLAERLH
jgi:hypothetical protein